MQIRFNVIDRIRMHNLIERYYGNHLAFLNSNRRNYRFPRHKDTISPELAKKIGRIGPKKKLAAITEFTSGIGKPYLIFRGYGLVPGNYPRTDKEFAERARSQGDKPSDDSIDEENVPKHLFRVKRRIDSQIGATIRQVGGDIDYRMPGVRRNLARNFVTADFNQELSDVTTRDIPQRFVTSTTQYPLPDASDQNVRTGGEMATETASFISYLGMRNWRGLPIYLLPICEVVRALIEKGRKDVIVALQEKAFWKFPPQGDDSRYLGDRSLHPILLRDPENDADDAYIVSFDAERVWPEDASYVEPLLIFRQTLDLCARSKARRIVLHRNDLLLVDNLRCLVCRYEFQKSRFRDAFNEKFFKRRRRVWLRQHVGYASKQVTHE